MYSTIVRILLFTCALCQVENREIPAKENEVEIADKLINVQNDIVLNITPDDMNPHSAELFIGQKLAIFARVTSDSYIKFRDNYSDKDIEMTDEDVLAYVKKVLKSINVKAYNPLELSWLQDIHDKDGRVLLSEAILSDTEIMSIPKYLCRHGFHDDSNIVFNETIIKDYYGTLKDVNLNFEELFHYAALLKYLERNEKLEVELESQENDEMLEIEPEFQENLISNMFDRIVDGTFNITLKNNAGEEIKLTECDAVKYAHRRFPKL